MAAICLCMFMHLVMRIGAAILLVSTISEHSDAFSDDQWWTHSEELSTHQIVVGSTYYMNFGGDPVKLSTHILKGKWPWNMTAFQSIMHTNAIIVN